MRLSKKVIFIAVILILIVVYLIMIAIDFSRIDNEKKFLKDTVADIQIMVSSGLTKESVDLLINRNLDDNFIVYKVIHGKISPLGYALTISLERTIDLYTPGLSLFMKDPYNVKIVKDINYESLEG